MEKENDFEDDKARHPEEAENEDEFLRARCPLVFLEFAKHLRELLFCQDTLARLSFHTERLLRHRSSVVSGPIPPRARQLDLPSNNPWQGMGNLRSIRENIENWEENLIESEGQIFPMVHFQSESVHWQKILQAAQSIEDAVRRLTRTTELTPEDIKRIQQEYDIAQIHQEEKPNPYKSEVWTFRDLQRDIEWLLPLIRSVATVCQTMGDFGHAREGRSAANVAYMSELFSQCAIDLEQDSKFFAVYSRRFPKSRLEKDQKRLAKDVAAIYHSSKILRQRKHPEWRLYTPPIIAELMGLSSVTVIRCIEEMEGRFRTRTKKEIKEAEEEMKAAGQDPLDYKPTYAAKVSKINEEGPGELRPRVNTGKARRAYNWKQAVEISVYYDSQPSRWLKRKARGQSLPESPE